MLSSPWSIPPLFAAEDLDRFRKKGSSTAMAVSTSSGVPPRAWHRGSAGACERTRAAVDLTRVVAV
jgi:hypothetical protein